MLTAPMKILVVGAGIGGLALAALARQRGVTVHIIERAAETDPAGYVIALYPAGSRVLHGLGVHDEFLARSAEFRFYDVHDGRGALLHRFDLRPVSERHGKIGQLPRAALTALLRSAAPDIPLRRGLSLAALQDRGDRVYTRFTDGSEDEWDAVIGADGIRSQTRRLAFEHEPEFETGWGLWVWWTDLPAVPRDTVSEYWGLGRFAGLYPTPDGVGAMAAGPRALLNEHAVNGEGKWVRQQFEDLEGGAAELLATFPDDTTGLFYRGLNDHCCRAWTRGRLALLGDAACSFLPAAGIGASMALESAAVMADELSRTNARFLPKAFALYEKRRRTRAENAQQDSHKLAAWLATNSPALAWTRDQFLRWASDHSLLTSIEKNLEDPL